MTPERLRAGLRGNYLALRRSWKPAKCASATEVVGQTSRTRAANARHETVSFLRTYEPEGLLAHYSHRVGHLEQRLKTPSWCDGFGVNRKALVQVLRWTETHSKIDVTRDVVSQVSDKMEVIHFKTR